MRKKKVTDDLSQGHKVTFMKNQEGKVLQRSSGAHLAAVVDYVHHEVVAHCEYCGRSLSRSDVNDYGSLCEACYMKEYYD